MTEQQEEQGSSLLTKKNLLIGAAAVLLVGGGSAAVLEFIGQVDGQAEVDAAVLMNGDTAFTDSNAFAVSDDETATGGGAIASNAYTLSNQANEIIPISLTKDTTIVSDSGDSQTVEEEDPQGVNTSFVFYTQRKATDSDGYGVDVSVNTNQQEVEDGNYQLEVASDGETNEYAIVWHPVSNEITADSSVEVTGNSSDDGVGVIDEVFVLTEDGELYVSADDSLDTLASLEEDSDEFNYGAGELDIAAVGLGYGDADLEGDARSVDVVIQDVQIQRPDGQGDLSLSATGEDIDFLPLTTTGESSVNWGGGVTFDRQHSFQTVTEFSDGFYTEDGNKVKVEATADFVE